MNLSIHSNALIFSERQNKLLLKRKEGSNIYYLPGTEVLPEVSATQALSKYLKDKLNIEIKNLFFVGTMERIEKKERSYSLIFKIELKNNDIAFPKNHYIYEWKLLPLERNIVFDPKYLKEDLSRWLKGKAVFLSTENKAFSS